ncbi:MAG: phosphomannomutase [Pseudomonadota bacterium]
MENGKNVAAPADLTKKILRISELMQSSGVAFGTSGARGLVSQMTDEICRAYVSAFLETMSRAFVFDRVALGIDLRPSSPGIAKACAAAIRAGGARVDYCGPTPTPALALYALAEGVPAVMVSGSHIPFDRNGIKFYRPDGEISKADENDITAAVVSLSETAAPGALDAVNPMALLRYERRVLDFFPSALLSGLHLGLYEHSSVSRDVFRQILVGLGASVTSLERTGEFVPIDTEAVSEEDMRRGRKWAEEYGFDAIISTDGDGDRPLLADENGTWMRGDIVGLICARFLGAHTVVVPVSCNTAIEQCGAFKRVVRTRIGSPYVIAGMETSPGDEASSIVGFEANGGFLVGSTFFREGRILEPLPTRDAVLPVLAVLAEAGERGGAVSDLVRDLPKRFTFSDRLRDFPTKLSRDMIDDFFKHSEKLHQYLAPQGQSLTALDMTDGLRATFSNGEIVHLRPSGNSPELRCYCEADSDERARKLTVEALKRIGGQVSEIMERVK